MKIYVAAVWDKKAEVKRLHDTARKLGHTITVDWTKHASIKPYSDFAIEAADQATSCLQGVYECDVFILLSDPGGRGMYVEFGAALLSYERHGKPHIYVIGEHTDNSVFYFHPAVKRRESLDEVLVEMVKVL